MLVEEELMTVINIKENICLLHVRGYLVFVIVDWRKFPSNWFGENLCPNLIT